MINGYWLLKSTIHKPSVLYCYVHFPKIQACGLMHYSFLSWCLVSPLPLPLFLHSLPVCLVTLCSG